MKDPYDVLGVPRDSEANEIKSAYRRLARKYHPDVNPNDPTAEEKFKEIGEAYSILSDPEKKNRFDRTGSADENPDPFFGGSGGFGDIFEMFFGGGGFSSQRQRRQGRDGEDLRADVEITLSEVVTGTHKDIAVRRMAQCSECNGTGSEGGAPPVQCPHCQGSGSITQTRNTFIGTVRTSSPCPHCGGVGSTISSPCSKCRGQGLVREESRVSVTIPPGVEEGSTMHLPGQGSEGTGYGRPGDLYVVLHVKEDARFERDSRNLITRVNITFVQACLGDDIVVPGVDGEYELHVSAGTQPGEVQAIRDGGLPPLHGGKRGDLLVIVQVTVPDRLGTEEIDLLKQFAELRGEPIPDTSSHSIFGNLFGKKKK